MTVFVTVKDTLKLQKDIDLLGSWARKWGMRFQPVKCNMMQLTNKRINKIEASYTLEGTVLETPWSQSGAKKCFIFGQN